MLFFATAALVLSAAPAMAQNTNPGSIVAWGSNTAGQTSVPASVGGPIYTQVSSGYQYTAALRSDGSAVAWGSIAYGQNSVPALPTGLVYTQVSAGYQHIAALRSDGAVVAWGNNASGQSSVPLIPVGLTTTQVSAGGFHTAALRSDGSAVAWGNNTFGQTSVPALPTGLSYTQVSAGYQYTAAIRSDGVVVAWGSNNVGQTAVPALPTGITYAQVSAGHQHCVALRSDGVVIAWGWNNYGQAAAAPALPSGITYTQVSAGYQHTAALRSDGSVVAWGNNANGQTTAPALPAGRRYASVVAGGFHTAALVESRPLTLTSAGTARVGMPLVYALTTWPASPLTPYLMDVSLNGSMPGLPVSAPAGGIIPLNPPFLFMQYGTAFPSLFTGFIGALDANGVAIATFNTSLHTALVGLSLSAAGVTIDTTSTTGIGRISNGVTLLLLAPIPVVSNVVPASGGTNGGDIVLINGSLFLAGASVRFSGIPATSVTVLSSTQITCTTPARSVGAANVSVINVGGVTGTLAGGYTYFYSNPAPTIGGIWPGSGDVLGATPVNIIGVGFLAGASVAFDGAAATQVVVANATSITCLTPPGTLGPANVTVTNVDTQTGTIAGGFTYVYANPAPTLGGVLPANGPIAGAAPVTISGTGFLAGASVTFNGAPATQVVVVSATSITCRTPALALGIANIVVTNPDTQVAVLANSFDAIANLSITAVTLWTPTPGAPITITGTGFQAGVQLVVGGATITPTSVSLAQIVFPMPAGVACTPQSVVVTNPSNQVASIIFGLGIFIVSVSPGAGPAAGGGTFFVIGSNFQPGTTLTVGGNTATIQVLAFAYIKATVPAGTVGSAAVVATAPSGCTATSTYIYQ